MQQQDRMRRRFKLRDLQTLDAVVRCGSMGKAATQLAVSQAAVSKAIGEMERAIGVSLLERTARGVEPTRAGRILIERGRVVFDEIDEGLREISALSDPAAGLVRLGTPEAISGFVGNTIAALVSRYPGMRFDVAISDTDSLIALLRERRLDVVLTRFSPDSVEKDLTARMLFEDQMVVLSSREHALARRRRIELEELMTEQWILSPPHTMLDVFAREAFAANGLPLPTAAVVTPSIYMRLTLLRTGHFVTLLPVVAARNPMTRQWLKALAVKLPRTPGAIAAITLKRRKMSRPVSLFCDAAAAAV